MEIRQLIGETAGQVWHLLSSDGPQTLPQLRRKLDGTSPFVDFAVGWLLREEKVEINQEKKSLRLRLK